MKYYLIGYDLNKEGQDYAKLLEAIRTEYGTRWKCLDSTWIVGTKYTATNIRDYLRQFIDKNDVLLVVGLSKEWACAHFNTKCTNWLQENLNR